MKMSLLKFLWLCCLLICPPLTLAADWLADTAQPGQTQERDRAGFPAPPEDPFQTEAIRTWLYDPDEPYSPQACHEIRPDSRGCRYEKYYGYSTEINRQWLEMWDESGDLAWFSSTEIFGEERQVPFSFARDLRGSYSDNLLHQPLHYTGQYFDEETGLYYNLHRYYDPHTGRFTQADPIERAGGINLYPYASDSLIWIDPAGLKGGKAGTALAKPGERNSSELTGLAKNKTQIPGAGGKKDYRLPDYLSADGHYLAETKNQNSMLLSSQLKDDTAHAGRGAGSGRADLIIDHRTKIRVPLLTEHPDPGNRLPVTVTDLNK